MTFCWKSVWHDLPVLNNTFVSYFSQTPAAYDWSCFYASSASNNVNVSFTHELTHAHTHLLSLVVFLSESRRAWFALLLCIERLEECQRSAQVRCVTHVNQSRRMHAWFYVTHAYAVSHIWTSHGAHSYASFHKYAWVMSYICMRHVTHELVISREFIKDFFWHRA